MRPATDHDTSSVAALLAGLTSKRRDDALSALLGCNDNRMPAWGEGLGEDYICTLADGAVLAWGAERSFGSFLSGSSAIVRDVVAYTGRRSSVVVSDAAAVDDADYAAGDGELDALYAERDYA